MILEKLEPCYRNEYECIWNENTLSNFEIDNKPTKNGISKKSLAFVHKKSFTNIEEEIEAKIQTLVDNFKIEDEGLFSKKFNMSISGNGEELTNMLTIISSALCPCLFFYNCENNPIKIELNNKLISFDRSFFEWKNPVIRNPSNMDVVLYSSEENILLFLESKFTEYLKNTQNPISNSYLENPITGPIYNKIFENKYYEPQYIDNTKKFFKLNSKVQHYSEGVKQIISHYCGIINFLNKKVSKENDYIKELPLDEKTQYYFAEILFTNKELENHFLVNNTTSCFEDYSKQYHQIEEILTADIKDRGIKNFTILPELYTYTKLKNDNPDLNKEIINFYFSK